MPDPGPYNLTSTYLRLRNDSSVEPLAAGDTFWERLIGGKLGDFHHEYLVVMTAFDADWPTWEKHPNGDEIVCMLDGSVEFILEIDGEHRKVSLSEAGSYVIVPQDTWHTAKVKRPSRMLFITAGEGTEIRADE